MYVEWKSNQKWWFPSHHTLTRDETAKLWFQHMAQYLVAISIEFNKFKLFQECASRDSSLIQTARELFWPANHLDGGASSASTHHHSWTKHMPTHASKLVSLYIDMHKALETHGLPMSIPSISKALRLCLLTRRLAYELARDIVFSLHMSSHSKVYLIFNF